MVEPAGDEAPLGDRSAVGGECIAGCFHPERTATGDLSAGTIRATDEPGVVIERTGRMSGTVDDGGYGRAGHVQPDPRSCAGNEGKLDWRSFDRDIGGGAGSLLS